MARNWREWLEQISRGLFVSSSACQELAASPENLWRIADCSSPGVLLHEQLLAISPRTRRDDVFSRDTQFLDRCKRKCPAVPVAIDRRSRLHSFAALLAGSKELCRRPPPIWPILAIN